MGGNSAKIIQTEKPMNARSDICELADRINNALFAIAGNAELIKLKVSGDDGINDHVAAILRLTRKIAVFTDRLSISQKVGG